MVRKVTHRRKTVEKKHKAAKQAKDEHVKGRRSTERTVNAPKRW